MNKETSITVAIILSVVAVFIYFFFITPMARLQRLETKYYNASTVRIQFETNMIWGTESYMATPAGREELRRMRMKDSLAMEEIKIILPRIIAIRNKIPDSTLSSLGSHHFWLVNNADEIIADETK